MINGQQKTLVTKALCDQWVRGGGGGESQATAAVKKVGQSQGVQPDFQKPKGIFLKKTMPPLREELLP